MTSFTKPIDSDVVTTKTDGKALMPVPRCARRAPTAPWVTSSVTAHGVPGA